MFPSPKRRIPEPEGFHKALIFNFPRFLIPDSGTKKIFIPHSQEAVAEEKTRVVGSNGSRKRYEVKKTPGCRLIIDIK